MLGLGCRVYGLQCSSWRIVGLTPTWNAMLVPPSTKCHARIYAKKGFMFEKSPCVQGHAQGLGFWPPFLGGATRIFFGET